MPPPPPPVQQGYNGQVGMPPPMNYQGGAVPYPNNQMMGAVPNVNILKVNLKNFNFLFD